MLKRELYVTSNADEKFLNYQLINDETQQIIYNSILCRLYDDEENLNKKRFLYFDKDLISNYYFDLFYWFDFVKIFNQIPQILTEKWNFEICNKRKDKTETYDQLIIRIYFEHPTTPSLLKLKYE